MPAAGLLYRVEKYPYVWKNNQSQCQRLWWPEKSKTINHPELATGSQGKNLGPWSVTHRPKR
jgi:hypothetical protein